MCRPSVRGLPQYCFGLTSGQSYFIGILSRSSETVSAPIATSLSTRVVETWTVFFPSSSSGLSMKLIQGPAPKLFCHLSSSPCMKSSVGSVWATFNSLLSMMRISTTGPVAAVLDPLRNCDVGLDSVMVVSGPPLALHSARHCRSNASIWSARRLAFAAFCSCTAAMTCGAFTARLTTSDMYLLTSVFHSSVAATADVEPVTRTVEASPGGVIECFNVRGLWATKVFVTLLFLLSTGDFSGNNLPTAVGAGKFVFEWI